MLALALLCCLASDALLVPAGRPAPYLEGKTLEGNSWGAELTGQVTIVEFFASWCPHCRRSLDGYRSLVAERRVQLIIVDVEEEPALVKEFFTRNPLPPGAGILLATEGQIKRRWGVSGLPAVFLIDQTGTVRDSFAGWGSSAARELAEQIDVLNKPRRRCPPATARKNRRSDRSPDGRAARGVRRPRSRPPPAPPTSTNAPASSASKSFADRAQKRAASANTQVGAVHPAFSS